MSDNTTLNPGSGGDVIGDDDIGGVKYQRIKIIHGIDGVNDGDTASTNGLPTKAGVISRSTASWTSSTANDTAASLTVTGYSTVILTLKSTSTMTGGTINFEVSDDSTTWFPIYGSRENASHFRETLYTLSANDTQSWSFSVSGWVSFRVRLNPQITGTGTLTLGLVTSAVPDISTASTVSRSNTSTLSNVSSSASNVTLLAANPKRIGATIFNDSTSLVYVKFGATASATSYTVQIASNGYYECPAPIYTGIIDGVWSSANGNARITELT